MEKVPKRARRALGADQPPRFAHRLALVGGVALQQPHRARQQAAAAGRVAFLDRDFEAAQALVAEERQAAGQGKERAEPDLAIRRPAPSRPGPPARDFARDANRRQAGEAGQDDAP